MVDGAVGRMNPGDSLAYDQSPGVGLQSARSDLHRVGSIQCRAQGSAHHVVHFLPQSSDSGASALFCPVTTSTTSLASMTVCTPTVRAIRGTADRSLLKNRQLSRMVS